MSNLYTDIQKQLNDILKEGLTTSTIKKVRDLLSEYANKNKDYELATVILAFYYTTRNYKEFDFLLDYYKKTYVYVFSKEKNNLFNYMYENDFAKDSIFDLTDDEFIKKAYESFEILNRNDMFFKNEKRCDFFEEIKNKCIEKNIIIPYISIESNNPLNSSYDKRLGEIIKEKTEKRDQMFSELSANIGVSKDNLINHSENILGYKDTLSIDKIDIDGDFLLNLNTEKMLISSKIASVPVESFRKIIEKIHDKKILKRTYMNIISVNGINVLKIDEEKTYFDKLATCSKEILSLIRNNAKKGLRLLKIVNEEKDCFLEAIKNRSKMQVPNYQDQDSKSFNIDGYFDEIEKDVIGKLEEYKRNL